MRFLFLFIFSDAVSDSTSVTASFLAFQLLLFAAFCSGQATAADRFHISIATEWQTRASMLKATNNILRLSKT